MSTCRGRWAVGLGALALVGVAAWPPGPVPVSSVFLTSRPFVWQQERRWEMLERLSRKGPTPEGLSAPAAVRHGALGRSHRERVERLAMLAEELARRQGYRPPYWQLVGGARTTGAAR